MVCLQVAQGYVCSIAIAVSESYAGMRTMLFIVVGISIITAIILLVFTRKKSAQTS